MLRKIFLLLFLSLARDRSLKKHLVNSTTQFPTAHQRGW